MLLLFYLKKEMYKTYNQINNISTYPLHCSYLDWHYHDYETLVYWTEINFVTCDWVNVDDDYEFGEPNYDQQYVECWKLLYQKQYVHPHQNCQMTVHGHHHHHRRRHRFHPHHLLHFHHNLHHHHHYHDCWSFHTQMLHYGDMYFHRH